jgi:hypothetical protein
MLLEILGLLPLCLALRQPQRDFRALFHDYVTEHGKVGLCIVVHTTCPHISPRHGGG